MFFWSPSIEILSRIMYEAAAAARKRLKDVGWGGGCRVTSDPADRLILSSQQPPLSLLFTSLNESWAGVKKEQAAIMKFILEGV